MLITNFFIVRNLKLEINELVSAEDAEQQDRSDHHRNVSVSREWLAGNRQAWEQREFFTDLFEQKDPDGGKRQRYFREHGKSYDRYIKIRKDTLHHRPAIG